MTLFDVKGIVAGFYCGDRDIESINPGVYQGFVKKEARRRIWLTRM
jgi:hypothetical protein